jgi:hypothetical protein
MVYFAGENRLFDEMVYGLKDLKRVGSDDDLSLVAQFSSQWVSKKYKTKTKPPTPLRFYLITDDEHPAGFVAKNLVPQENPKPPKSYVKELIEFLSWGIDKYPAEHYMVVLAGDGGGVLSDFLPSTSKPPKSIKPYELTEVFRKVCKKLPANKKKIDIVGLDSCLMGMTEIGYGLRKHVEFLVSSQGNEDDLGWPYSEILKVLKAHDLPARDLAVTAVDGYTTYYLDYALIAGASATLSAVDLSKMEKVKEAVTGFTKAARKLMPASNGTPTPTQNLFVALLVNAHWTAQTYRHDQYVDVFDFFCKLREQAIRVNVPDFERVIKKCKEVMDSVRADEKSPGSDSSVAVVKSCSVGMRYQYSYGLSLYFPWAVVNYEYFQLPGDYEADDPRKKRSTDAFARATGWGKFLKDYVRLSERPVRESKANIPKDFEDVLESFLRDPPDGRGLVGTEYDASKNPPSRWEVASCVIDPILNQ